MNICMYNEWGSEVKFKSYSKIKNMHKKTVQNSKKKLCTKVNEKYGKINFKYFKYDRKLFAIMKLYWTEKKCLKNVFEKIVQY